MLGSGTLALRALAGRSQITLGVRPEDVVASGHEGAGSASFALEGKVGKVTYAGREAFYRWVGDDGLGALVHVSRPDAGTLKAASDRLRIEIPIERLHAFDPEDGRRIELTQ
jgi:hypothetical protein